MLSVYLLATFALAVGRHSDAGWHLFPVLLVTFATYHLSYGLGFLTGMTRGFSRPDQGSWTLILFSAALPDSELKTYAHFL